MGEAGIAESEIQNPNSFLIIAFYITDGLSSFGRNSRSASCDYELTEKNKKYEI